MKKWYAVQVDDYDAWDIGSHNKREAIKIANRYKKNHSYDGKKIKIAMIVNNNYCESEIIIR